ncbi:hypothetical protein HYH03_010096 [Edaphochlamys debaryana]|uniref:Exostosin GT47 domain-containing protein n=1 Tax=Edaphochlamys debaryana TaxID=47281 RepID=A0A835XX70_9CHLO|nr:hypothetical protein HYH03_010096 [Edaphochlamys debaryana]|eukprot:KAG2491520.1 hypothetical protein HYH03_010096 [Edaphochlamys debaryana]
MDYGEATCQEELGRCDCPKFLSGDDCGSKRPASELKAYRRDAAREKHRPLPCLNNCSGLGGCAWGDCICTKGHFGSDCSLSLDPATSKPLVLAGQGYSPRKKRPLVYVYDIPHKYSSWHNYGLVDRALPWVFWERLAGSGALTADGEEADWFFLPVKLRVMSDGYELNRAIKYVRKHWPWYDRYQGHRHFVIHTGDTGRGEVPDSTRALAANLTWLHHWGLTSDWPSSGWKAAHRRGKDVVVPIYFGGKQGPSHVPMSGLHPRAPRLKRENVLLFAGRICGDSSEPHPSKEWPHCRTQASAGYSQGARQLVHFHHHMRPGYKIVTRDPLYQVDLLSYRWCLSPSGGGHGHRQTLAAVVGCLPLVVSDDVMQPFEPEMDWSRFSIRVAHADIPGLHGVLGGVGEEAYQRMQDAARCAAQHLVFSTMSGAFMQEDGRWDAFEFILEILRMQQSYPGLDPAKYAETDEQYRNFVNCGEVDMSAFGAKARAAAAARYPVPLAMPGLPNDTVITWEHLYAENGKGLARLIGAAGQHPKAEANTSLPLCSFSRWDLEPLRCVSRGWRQRARAARQAAVTVPGGAACNEAGSVASCARLWA